MRAIRKGAAPAVQRGERLGTANTSLWFDRCCSSPGNNDAVSNWLDAMVGLGRALRSSNGVYRMAFDRWMAYQRTRFPSADDDLEPASILQPVDLDRVVVGLGDKGVKEIGLTLSHTFGAPYLPGTALKGLAARYARRILGDLDGHDSWRPGGEDYDQLFGTQTQAGVVDFLDAWYDPGSPADPFVREVMTVHHQGYYMAPGRGDPPPPADWDAPNPNPFVACTGRFQLVTCGPGVWAETAMQLLTEAIRDLGIGAKTSSGFGRSGTARVNPALLGDDGEIAFEETKVDAPAAETVAVSQQPAEVSLAEHQQGRPREELIAGALSSFKTNVRTGRLEETLAAVQEWAKTATEDEKREQLDLFEKAVMRVKKKNRKKYGADIQRILEALR